MATNKKLKAFARIDGSGRVVPGTLLLRERKPKVGKWKEVDAYECCNTIDACFTATFSYAPDGGDNVAIFIGTMNITGAPNLTGTITWGDGQSDAISIVYNNNFTYTHTYSEFGLYTINVCIDNPEYIGNVTINPDAEGGSPISSISGLNNLRHVIDIDLGYNSLTTLSVTNLPNLVDLTADNNQLTSVDLSGLPTLDNLRLSVNNLTSVDLSGLFSLITVDINDNLLTESAVDSILVTLASGPLNLGDVNLFGGSNSAPSAIGLAAKTTLEGRGWTVTVNP
jgi:hypothetical protein